MVSSAISSTLPVMPVSPVMPVAMLAISKGPNSGYSCAEVTACSAHRSARFSAALVFWTDSTSAIFSSLAMLSFDSMRDNSVVSSTTFAFAPDRLSLRFSNVDISSPCRSSASAASDFFSLILFFASSMRS